MNKTNLTTEQVGDLLTDPLAVTAAKYSKQKDTCHPNVPLGSTKRRTFEELLNMVKLYRTLNKEIDLEALIINSGWDKGEVAYTITQLGNNL